jgi:hypothetical protein
MNTLTNIPKLVSAYKSSIKYIPAVRTATTSALDLYEKPSIPKALETIGAFKGIFTEPVETANVEPLDLSGYTPRPEILQLAKSINRNSIPTTPLD